MARLIEARIAGTGSAPPRERAEASEWDALCEMDPERTARHGRRKAGQVNDCRAVESSAGAPPAIRGALFAPQ